MIGQAFAGARTAGARLGAWWALVPGNLRGIFWMLLMTVTFLSGQVVVKLLAPGMHPFEITFFRCFFTFAASFPFLMRGGVSALRTSYFHMHALRGLFGGLAMLGVFYGVANMPLSSVNAIAFTRPLFMILLAVLFLGEVVQMRRWAATVVGFIGVAINISTEKHAQEALRKHRDHLAELVTEKTASLIQAKEAAERANEAKSLFLANMSHELRSPMHAVLSYARLGEDKAHSAPPDKLRDYFHRIRRSGDRLLSLVDNLLDLSKLEAGRMTLDMQALSLGEVATEMCAEFDGLCGARQIRVRTALDASAPPVIGDAVRLGQVVRNLLSNAIKFSPDGGTITVVLRTETPPAGPAKAVQLQVIDQGVGIPESELEAVFDKFVQSSATRTGAGGTGLGLAICREILSAHGGRIRASNVAGGGACFEIVLPAADVVGETPGEESKPS